jgi:hypothetical protein
VSDRAGPTRRSEFDDQRRVAEDRRKLPNLLAQTLEVTILSTVNLKVLSGLTDSAAMSMA